MTLLEVLVSLLIAGILAAIVLRMYISQYGSAKNVLLQSDITFSLVRAGEVLTAAVTSADNVEWTGSELLITNNQNGVTITDSYYIADKDLNGITDLYREHLNVPSPIASRLTKLNCRNIQDELWEIIIIAEEGQTTLCWERTMRQIAIGD